MELVIPLVAPLRYLGGACMILGGLFAAAGLVGIVPYLVGPSWYRKQEAQRKRRRERREKKRKEARKAKGS